MSKPEISRPRSAAATPTRAIQNDPGNTRKHTDRNKAMIRASLEEIGAFRSIGIDGENIVRAGNGVFEQAQEMGLKVRVVDAKPDELVAVRRADLKGRKAIRASILDNRTAELSRWNSGALAELARDDRTVLQGLFDSKELEHLLGSNPEDPPDIGTEMLQLEQRLGELERKWKVKRGELWMAGDHRILCGDATNPQDVGRLMAGQQANLVFTDPPYGVSYSGLHHVDPKYRRVNRPIAGDDKRGDELARWLQRAFELLMKHSTQNAAFYIWHSSSTREDYYYAMKAAGLEERQYIIWAKQSGVMGLPSVHYQWAHEPCFYAGRPGGILHFNGDHTETTMWRLAFGGKQETGANLGQGILVSDGKGHQVYLMPGPPKGKKVRRLRLEPGQTLTVHIDDGLQDLWDISRESTAKILHPTQKPPALAVRAIENSTLPGAVVIDTFLGSGSTLVACQMTGRQGRGTEIEPRYMCVILERLEAMGLKPTRQT